MKTLIKTSAFLFVFGLLSTGAFAAGKTVKEGADAIALTESASNDCAVNISIDKATTGNSLVTIYDGADNVIMKDALSKEDKTIQKGYDFTGLEDGDYTIAVSSNNETVKKTVHVYSDENDQKSSLVE